MVDVLNNIVRSFETEEEENRFDQNLNDINETIKKDNQQFLTKTKKKRRQKKPFLKYQQHQHHHQRAIHLLIYFPGDQNNVSSIKNRMISNYYEGRTETG